MIATKQAKSRDNFIVLCVNIETRIKKKEKQKNELQKGQSFKTPQKKKKRGDVLDYLALIYKCITQTNLN